MHVVMHEMTHVLMMDSSLFPLFRHKDVARSPRTPRDPLYPNLPAPQFNLLYRCNEAGGNVLSYVPGNSTVQWFAERGMACNALTASAGNCVVRMVSPAAQAGAREFFGCADLPGPELENDDTSPCQKVGSHWETRVAYSDSELGSYPGLPWHVCPETYSSPSPSPSPLPVPLPLPLPAPAPAPMP